MFTKLTCNLPQILSTKSFKSFQPHPTKGFLSETKHKSFSKSHLNMFSCKSLHEPFSNYVRKKKRSFHQAHVPHPPSHRQKRTFNSITTQKLSNQCRIKQFCHFINTPMQWWTVPTVEADNNNFPTIAKSTHINSTDKLSADLPAFCL